ncbi:hypothetical protein [Litorihabitans aurantiacus]|uniref:hypothetical protein n=1 Tax=Litorihabitans aurantiacus TaxID=1930061 RepID=UPI0024E16896|nr:hypothetical protein [Litorihabitans aurantiacus]
MVQEGLTNARKHAPGAAVEVLVQCTGGVPGGTIQVVVSNAVVPGLTRAELPGAGTGQLGLAERTAHHGGSLESTVEDGRFVLRATVPLGRVGSATARETT